MQCGGPVRLMLLNVRYPHRFGPVRQCGQPFLALGFWHVIVIYDVTHLQSRRVVIIALQSIEKNGDEYYSHLLTKMMVSSGGRNSLQHAYLDATTIDGPVVPVKRPRREA